MPVITPIRAIHFPYACQKDISQFISPPYDVLNETTKAALLDGSDCNIVKIDLPHLPPKTVGPDATYAQAGQWFAQWLSDGTLLKRQTPSYFVYQQTYTVDGKVFKRKGLIGNVQIKEFGPSDDGTGGIFPHEQTFSAPKADRLKLMQQTQAQLSPIFGLYSDATNSIGQLLSSYIAASEPTFYGTTANDDVLHEVWLVEDAAEMKKLSAALTGKDLFIADGHHRYNTALNYKQDLETSQSQLPADHPANACLFVMVAIEDPGMIVLPTHRVLGNMKNFSIPKLNDIADALSIIPFEGTLEELEAALPKSGYHAMGLYDPTDPDADKFIATTLEHDPLEDLFPEKSEAWRQLDVAIVQHILVERCCEPHFCASGDAVTWKFPHSLQEMQDIVQSKDYQLAVIVQATPLQSVADVSNAQELMPQKSTFFYPKLATGLAINPIK